MKELRLSPGNLLRMVVTANRGLHSLASRRDRRPRQGCWANGRLPSLLHTVLTARSPALDRMLHPSCTQGSMRPVGPETS
jgi:hypothetical protein